MSTKNITVTVCFDVDLFEYNRYFKVRKADGEVIAIDTSKSVKQMVKLLQSMI